MSLFNLTRSSTSKFVTFFSESRWAKIRGLASKWPLTPRKLYSCDRVTPHYRLCNHFSTSSCTASDGTVDNEEIAKFDYAAFRWWSGAYGNENAGLHTMNVLRVPLIRDALIQHQASRLNQEVKASDESPTPLSGLTILDVGCGGGILSEPLARLGAKVTGLDASDELIRVANAHADIDLDCRSRLTYYCTSIEEFCRVNVDSRFDGVVASEIVEHVANLDSFVAACCSVVKPGGSIFITTMNKTCWSYISTILAAERIFRVVPQGMHDWNKYVPPEDLEHILRQNEFTVRRVHGMVMNPLTLNWCWIKDTSANYAMHAVKTADKPTMAPA